MTIIKEDFTQDTTLTSAGSPYIMCVLDGGGYPTVKPGVTLNIEPGVKILMGSGRIEYDYVACAFVNEGIIRASGAVFTYYDQDGDGNFDPSERWENIRLRDGSSSYFENCTFQYGSNYMIDATGYGPWHIDLSINGGLIRSGYDDPPVGGIWFSPLTGSLNIDGTHFSCLTDNPIVVQDGGPTVEVNISNCLIDNSSQQGIIVRNGIASITCCQFVNNCYFDITMYEWRDGPESIIIKDNYFDAGGKDKYPIAMTARTKVNQGIAEHGNTYVNYSDVYLYAMVQHDIPEGYHAYWGDVGLTRNVPKDIAWVAENASLTIAPGQSILLQGYELKSRGDFQALGTTEAPIRFYGEAGITQVYGKLLMEHCILNGTGFGIKGYSRNDSDISDDISFVVDNCTFTNLHGDAVHLEGNNYNIHNTVIKNSSFINNKGRGLTLEGWPGPARNFGPSSMTITHNIIAGNAEQSDLPPAGAYLDYCNAIFENCTIVSNKERGIYADDGCKPSLTNCIIWDNSIYDETCYEMEVSYCCIDISDKEIARFGGEGNINVAPIFADALNNDYHLKSTCGRWDPLINDWVSDDASSPCIDRGDPESSYINEPEPNNQRINQGVFGNTIFASKSGETADLSISKIDHPDPVPAGFNLRYNLSISNYGPDNASNVTVTDLLPWNVQFLSASSSQGTCNITGDTLSCELGNLEKDGTASVTIDVIPTTDDKITNTAWVSSTAFDPDTDHNSVTQDTSIIPTGTTVGSWHLRSAGTSQDLKGVCYGNGTFVTVGALNYGVLISEDGLSWNRIDVPAYSLNEIAYGQGKFVSVGWNGLVISSYNAVNWEVDNFGIPAHYFPPTLWGITYGHDIFVTAGSGGNIYTTDPVAMRWIKRDSETSNAFYGLTHGNDTFIAVGEYATISKSADGINWSTIILGTSTADDLWSAAYGKGRYVAVGNGGKIVSSVDTVNWVPETSGTTDSLRRVSYANGIFVAVGFEGTILTSFNGTEWHETEPNLMNTLWGIGYGDNCFVLVGDGGTILQSDPLLYRASLTLSKNATPDRVTAGSELVYTVNIGNNGPAKAADVQVYDHLPSSVSFVSASSSQGSWSVHAGIVVCNLGLLDENASATLTITVIPTLAGNISNSVIARGANSDSADSSLDTLVYPASPLDQWHRRDIPIPTARINSITYGNPLFIAVGSDGTIFSSTFGVEWTNVESPVSASLNAVNYLNGLYLAAGDGGAILTSLDGLIWTEQHSDTDKHLHDISYGEGQYIIVGDDGTILTSTDGNDWSSDTVTDSNLRGITRGNQLFVAVGTGGSILNSTDGSEWTAKSSGTVSDLNSIAYGNGQFITTGDEGTIVVSHDGNQWTVVESGIDKPLYSIAYGDGIFIITASLYSSSDGNSWTERYVGTDAILFGAAFGNNSFVVVGDNGIILQSDPLSAQISRGINLFE